MARNLRKKASKKLRKKTMCVKRLYYSVQQMADAIEAVRAGKPVAVAAREHEVPRVSLHYKVKGIRPVKTKMGPDSFLTANEEAMITEWVVSMARAGFCISKTELLDSVQRYLEGSDRITPFKNNRPGRKWFNCFMKRNPTISIRTAQNLTIPRASISTEDLRPWFLSVHKYLEGNNISDIMKDPRRIFNADETAFFLNPKGSKVLAPKGDKTVYQVGGDEKECITVLITANAEGKLASPLLVFRYERIPQELANSVPPNWAIGKSEKGWMTGASFFEFISNVFDPWLEEMSIQRPVIFFIDGHTSHLTLHCSEFCNDHGIILVALYPNATHLIQPMDVSVFHSLKSSWKEKTNKWRIRNVSQPKLKKKDFAPLLREVLGEMDPQIIVNGFRKCGLFPWNPNVVVCPDTLQPAGPLMTTPMGNLDNQKTLSSTGMLSALRVMEHFIGESKVEHFKSKDVCGAQEDQALFQLWREMKEATSRSSPQSAQHQVMKPLAEGTPSSGEFEFIPEPSTSRGNDIQPTVSPMTNDRIAHNIANSVPSPFKKAFIWPEAFSNPKKKRTKEILPSVITSQSWREYHEKKTKRKLYTEQQKAERALLRERKKAEKEKQQENRKLEKCRKNSKSSRRGKKINRKRKQSSSSSSSSSEIEIPSDPEDDHEEIETLKSSPTIGVGVSIDTHLNRSCITEETQEISSHIDESAMTHSTPKIETKGLCFKCGASLSKNRIGFACDVCNKKYHKVFNNSVL